MLSSGSFDIDGGDPRGFMPLMCAAFAGHASVCRILVNKGANVFIKEDQGATALFFSVQQGHLEVTKLLVQAGSELELRTKLGYTPLHKAAVKGHTEEARVLVGAGANSNCRGPSETTPLWAAAFQGHKDVVTLLLRANANPLLGSERAGEFASLPLDVAAQNRHTDVVIDLIQQVGIEGCGGVSGGINALCMAAKNGHVGIMVILTDAGVVDTGEALCVAAESALEESVKFLLQKQQQKGWASPARGGYVNATVTGRTPLGCSIDACSPRVARCMLDAGADTTWRVLHSTKVRFKSDETPLAYTVDFMRELTDEGKDANEEKLHKLEAIRRMLLQVDAVHAVSWLWLTNASSVGADGAERTRRTKTTLAAGTPLTPTLPILRWRAGRRGVLLAALWR